MTYSIINMMSRSICYQCCKRLCYVYVPFAWVSLNELIWFSHPRFPRSRPPYKYEFIYG